MYSIELKAVTKSFNGHIAVKNLSLKVPEKSIYGFIGPNGSGKTTTIRMIMNILYPDHGEIRLFGKKRTGSCLDRVGYLPEERGLYKKMKVKDLLKFHAELKNGNNISKEINYWLERLALEKWANQRVETLSKGMMQKLQFITTIIDHPEIIILDEPFSGLDPVNAEVIKSSILELRSQGSTVIFSTHDMHMAELMCDYIFMIYQGEKVLDGTLESIQDKYGSDTIRIQSELGMESIKDIQGIETINDYGQMQEIRYSKDTDTQKILAELMKRTKIKKFEITRPSLHDIFIRIARPTEIEKENA